MSRLRTRMMQGYFQFWDNARGAWVFVHRRVAEKRAGGALPPPKSQSCHKHDTSPSGGTTQDIPSG